MKRNSRLIATLALLLTSLSAVPAAHAVLQARGAVSPLNGYPTWYQDTNGLALSLCLDQTPIGAPTPGPTACVLEPNFDPDPAAALFRSPVNGPLLTITPDKAITPIGPNTFPGEAFYFMAGSPVLAPSPGGVISLILYEAAIEAGFASAIVDGGQAVFTRIRARANVTLPGTYTMTHPYGTETFVVDAVVPGPEINFTNDIPGLVPGQFDLAVTGGVGFGPPFVGPTLLTNANPLTPFFIHPVTGERYIGDNATPVQVQGGVGGVNAVTITGPVGVPGTDTLTFNTFILMGKVIGIEITPPAGGNNFGVIKLAAASVPKTYTVTNFTGLANTIAPLVSSNPAFTFVADTCSNVVLNAVAPGNTCTFGVVLTPVAEGAATGTITVSSVNAPNATVSVSGTGDGTAPVVAVTGISRFTKTATQTISGTVTDLNGVPANGVQVAIDGGAPANATVVGSNWTFPVPALVAQDPITGLPVHNIVVTANDNALPAPGNLATPVNETIVVDQTLPEITLTLQGNGTRTKIATPVLNFLATDTNLASTIVKVDGTILNPQPLSGAAMAKLADGLRTVRVEALDAAGNAAFKEASLTVDTIVSPFTLTAVTTPTRTTTQTIKGTVEAGSTVQVKVGAAAAAAATVTGTTWSFPIATLAEGANNITVTATDTLGNTGTSTSSIKIVLPDGKITGAATVAVADALKSLQFAAGLNQPTAEETLHADVAPLVNGVPAPDGKVDIGDVVLILRKAVGLVNF